MCHSCTPSLSGAFNESSHIFGLGCISILFSFHSTCMCPMQAGSVIAPHTHTFTWLRQYMAVQTSGYELHCMFDQNSFMFATSLKCSKGNKKISISLNASLNPLSSLSSTTESRTCIGCDHVE